MSRIIVPLFAAIVLICCCASASGSPVNDELIKAIHRSVDLDHHNVISTPDNCQDGYLLVNGVCREVWSVIIEYLEFIKSSDPEFNNVVSVPDNCPTGQQLVNGVCREVWAALRERLQTLDETQRATILRGLLASSDFAAIRNIISVPTQCPEGYLLDVNGNCRQVWG